MILYASQRGRSAELALHLLNGEQNEHVSVHDIRGFVSNDLAEALKEAYAISRGTRCKQFLFSLSLNPPEYADVPIEDFEAAIEEIEKRLALVGQPRIIVFHEKNGRRHCHAVWSRIDADKLVAIRMSHFKRKLMETSRLLYLKHGWKMPKGMEKGQPRTPLHLTREEYRQAVRLAEDPQAMKSLFKTAWERSDSKETFIHALEEQGLLLARGDRRGYVAIDVKGGVFSLTRWLDIGTRDLKTRLGVPESLPDIGQAKAYLVSRMTENLERFIAEAKAQAAQKRTPLVQELRTLVHQQRAERREFLKIHQKRWEQETRQRTARLHTGVAGVWQCITGEYQKVCQRNEAETRASLERDRRELHALVRSHLLERQELQKTVLFYRKEHQKEVFRLRQEIACYVSTATEPLLPKQAAMQSVTAAEKVSLAAQLAQIEAKLGLLTGNIAMLQVSLESSLISDEMRSKIRRLIERTLETLHLKALETKEEQKQRSERKAQEIQMQQAQFNEYVRQYAQLQMKMEEENRRQATTRSFYEVIMAMSYSLNGLPKWEIKIMLLPEERRLNERKYSQEIAQLNNADLLGRVFRPPVNESLGSRKAPIDPKTAVPALRQSVLEVKELLSRAGIQPSGGNGSRSMAPAQIRMTTSTKISFNNPKR